MEQINGGRFTQEGDMWFRIAFLVLASTIVVLIGQVGRELLPPDDLREVEVAREMYEGGDYIVPHLAGLTFVEKPSGFPAVIAAVFRVVGSPSADAARFVAAAFAILSLTAVFLLGRHVLGVEGGALAAAILAFSQRFCRSAHTVLLDNALTAAVAFTVLFTWIALEAGTPGKKRLAYTAAGFSLGSSFLFKGFTGPALFASGFLLYLILSKRFSEVRYILRPLPIIAFLVPFLAWNVPFFFGASSDLVREFYIANHVGRFMSGYLSRKHPFYFYLTVLWPECAPSSVLLPLAIFMAWKTRKEWENRAGIFFLSLSLGPIILLSASVAKDYVYLLPVHPALAMLAAWAIIKGWTSSGRVVKVLSQILAIATVLATGAMLVLTCILGGAALSMTVATVVFAFATGGSFFLIRGHDLRWTSVFIALMIALGWSLWFTGPMAQADVARRSMHQTMGQVLNLVGDRDVLLYHPTDGLRGEASFYRNRTAQELTSAEGLVSRLAGNQNKVVALIFSPREEVLPVELSKISQAMETHLQIEACFDFGNKYLHIVSGQAFGRQANDSRK